MELQPKTKWLIWTSVLSLALIITYIFLHKSHTGKVDLSLNKEQINAINLILENDTIPERAQITALNYISDVLSLTDTTVLKRFFKTYQYKDIKTILTEYSFEVKSYFWLKEPRVFLEIIFWSLFGLMANLMYSVNIAEVFEKKRIYEHIGKIFYTPASTIIIYLSLYALVNSGSISLNGVGKSVIVLSFVLGFFTRRTIVLLGKIKDLILPLGEDETKKKKETKETKEIKSGKINGLIEIEGVDDKTFEEIIKKVKITLISEDDKSEKGTCPDDAGMFSFDNIPIGKYKIVSETEINKVKYYYEETIELKDDKKPVKYEIILKKQT